MTPTGEDLTFTYDEAGRLKTELTPDGTTTYEYDALGRVKRVIDQATGFITESHFDTLVGKDPDPGIADNLIGQLTGRTLIIDENTRYTTSYTYYADGKTKSMTDANGNTWFYEYTTNTSTVIDPLGRRTTNVQTDQYLPSETIYADGTKTTVEYLYHNNLLEGSDYPTMITDRGGNTRHFNYDDSGRLISATDLGNTTYSYTYGDYGLASINSPTNDTILSYSYDNEGNLQTVNYADGGVKKFVYDEKNQLSQVTLPTGIMITYEYNEAGEEIRRTSSLEGEVLTQWNANKDLLSITDNTGTTTYHYDENTGQLEAINYSNGQRIEYEYDKFGRTTSVTVKETSTSKGYTTSYEYDALGNLTLITDPNGGETIMVYDGVNRLTKRTLPNGIKTTYTYQKNTDWIETITHSSANGEVLASIEYVREGTGEPTKIIREDGSYVELDYDDSLRVIKEGYYDNNGILIDETEYSYDADGNRLTVSNGDAEGSYIYENIHQLTEIMTETGRETYTYDEGGRIKTITRDGETWNLEYNSMDLITKITNSNGEVLIEYEYDSNGRIIEAQDRAGERNYLVANLVGTDLESPYLITNENGEFVSGYVYGGSMPILRLDENGNPIYYLTDAMGSVIGLADGNGAEIAEFEYDNFGNLRNSEGNDLGLTGGDFRFQGQWLESNTDLYHFRARYYDPETGRFISRDPVEIIEYEPESSNPYQFVYNNPQIYSDPGGEFTITEINASQAIQDALASVRSYAGAQAKDYILQRLGDSFGNIVLSTLNAFLPGSTVYKDIIDGLLDFEDGLKGIVCDYFEGLPLKDNLFLEVKIHNGVPQNNGLNCSNHNQPPTNPKIAKKLQNQPGSEPDFMFRNSPPLSYSSKDPGAYLVGDLKSYIGSTRRILKPGRERNQWLNMADYAQKFQILPFVSYLALTDSNILNPFDTNKNPKGLSKFEREKLAGEALRNGVILVLANIIDQ